VSGDRKPDNLTKASIKQFSTFLKFLASNSLIDKAEEHLQSKGVTDIWISLEPIKEVQRMIDSELSRGTKLTQDARTIILSPHKVDFPSQQQL